jgi:hypothetical protein
VEKWNNVIHRRWKTANCGKKVFHRGKTFHRGKGAKMKH